MPEGLLYHEEFLSQQDEAGLLAEIRRLPLEEAKYKSFTAKRRIAAYGSSYDFETNELGPAPAIPVFLSPLRSQVATLVSIEEGRFTHALVTEYRPGTELGWHRDIGAFGIVVGVSLGGSCRMRFRRYPPAKGAKIFTLELAPRSVYVLRDEIRWRWQHSVARTKELRYSITFRTPR
ncbi:MAG TPA: alpha-ketoglutarate-dependent dioxygenase AlkB [Burkholderiales bacterium]|jgi:alkylated DNA repair dioxygenase AlkB|nr:alpha-ketoglutarate-dependent dioxygenase AlkB [Burkholderiales bacterium]